MRKNFMHTFIKTLIILCLAFSLYAEEKEDTRPNILFITPTNIGIDQFKQYNGLHHETPNIDKLAKNGMRFTYYFGRSNYVASFRALLSGTTNALVGWESNDWPQRFSGRLADKMDQAGYETCFVGKWGFPNDADNMQDWLNQQSKGGKFLYFSYPWNEGFKHYYGVLATINRKKDWNESDRDIFWKGEIYKTNAFKIPTIKSKYTPDKNVNFIKNFIDYTQRKEKRTPFYLWWAPLHLWYHPESWVYDTPDSRDKLIRTHDIKIPHASARTPKENDLYYANIRYMDKMIGQVLDKLKEAKIEKETLVIFASLSGTTAGVPGIYNGEQVLGANSFIPESKDASDYNIITNENHLERNHRLPMFAYWPGTIEKGSICSFIFSTKDFFFTLGKLSHAKDINKWVKKPLYKAFDYSPVFYGHFNKGARRFAVHMYFAHRGLDRRQEFPNLIWAQTKEYKLYSDGRFYSLRTSVNEKKKLTRLSPLEKAIKAKLKRIIDINPKSREYSQETDPLHSGKF